MNAFISIFQFNLSIQSKRFIVRQLSKTICYCKMYILTIKTRWSSWPCDCLCQLYYLFICFIFFVKWFFLPWSAIVLCVCSFLCRIRLKTWQKRVDWSMFSSIPHWTNLIFVIYIFFVFNKRNLFHCTQKNYHLHIIMQLLVKTSLIFFFFLLSLCIIYIGNVDFRSVSSLIS